MSCSRRLNGLAISLLSHIVVRFKWDQSDHIKPTVIIKIYHKLRIGGVFFVKDSKAKYQR